MMMVKSSFRKNKFLIFPLLVIIIVLAVVLVLEESNARAYGQIGTVDGIPISSKLFGSKLIEDRTKQKALDDCIRIIVQQELAIKYGIIKDADYEKIEKDCVQENKKRKQDLADGKPIYGPVEYSPENYFSYVFSNMVIKLKTKLGQTEFKLDDAALEKMYEAQKDQFKLVSIRINRISLPVTDENGNADPVKSQEAGEKIKDMLTRIKAGESFEDLAKAVNKNGTVMEQVFDDSTAHMDSRINPELREAAEGMSPNQVSDIIELEDLSLNLIKCEEYKVEGYMKFEDVKENIRARYIDTKYEEYIDQLVRKARVDIDQKAFEAQ